MAPKSQKSLILLTKVRLFSVVFNHCNDIKTGAVQQSRSLSGGVSYPFWLVVGDRTLKLVEDIFRRVALIL